MTVMRFRTQGTDSYGGIEITDNDGCSRYVEYDDMAQEGRVYYVDPRTHQRTEAEPWSIESDRALIYAIRSWLDNGCSILPGWLSTGKDATIAGPASFVRETDAEAVNDPH